MMKQKEALTNESLKGICKSNFELAQYAIRLGRFYIRSGRETTLQGLIDEVKKHPNPDYLHHLEDLEKIEES